MFLYRITTVNFLGYNSMKLNVWTKLLSKKYRLQMTRRVFKWFFLADIFFNRFGYPRSVPSIFYDILVSANMTLVLSHSFCVYSLVPFCYVVFQSKSFRPLSFKHVSNQKSLPSWTKIRSLVFYFWHKVEGPPLNYLDRFLFVRPVVDTVCNIELL